MQLPISATWEYRWKISPLCADVTLIRVPKSEYESRLKAARERLVRTDLVHSRLAMLRLVVFVIAASCAWYALWTLWFAPLLFGALVFFQARAARERRFAERSIRFYESGIARIEDQWAGHGESGERFRDPSHPYADDLDLFGTGSLFELLSTARTRAGEAQLAAWLKQPAEREELLRRQEAVEELRARTDLREQLAALGEDFRTGVMPEDLARWGGAERVSFAAWMQPLALVFSLIGASLLVGYFSTGLVWVRVALVIAAVVEGLFALPLRGKVLAIVSQVEQPSHDLDLLSQVLERFEKEQFQSPKLAGLRAELEVQGKPASKRIAQLQRLTDLLHSRDNLVVRMVGPLVLWTTQVAFAVERWRAVSGPSVGKWLAAVGELEALCALAGYAYEHPDDPFPEIGNGYRGEGLGHPLLAAALCVRNDIELGSERPLVVISGSNMSGKSTYLRTVGVNAVMALAGAPVRARALRIGVMQIGASIRVSDSLQGGTSRFYAEITRLREIVKLAESGPALFLLDELLNGTNSHDRGIGAAGVVRGLVARGAIGLVTTHDLALTHIGDRNQHFEDHLEGGEITFDYRIRPGVVEKSNALELMRAVGLDV